MQRIEFFSMLSIKNLTKTYEDAAVVDDVTIDLPPGKVISLIGPNGAGKSTVLGMISRLIARTAGIVEFKGRDITHWESRELAKHLAILTQANFVQMKLTVRELVAFGRFPHSGSALSADDWTKVDQAIHYMELEAFADRFIDEMSGGQRQRAFIAMVLAQDTEYVLLDEPTNNLDIYHATQMMKLVRRLCDELGKTVILVLHEINLAAFYSDVICAFKDGRIAAQGTVDEVMTPETSSAYTASTLKFTALTANPSPSSTDPFLLAPLVLHWEQPNPSPPFHFTLFGSFFNERHPPHCSYCRRSKRNHRAELLFCRFRCLRPR